MKTVLDVDSAWYHFDWALGRFVFTETEDHIFAPGTKAQQRIGDMDRDGLIMALGTGYHDREMLARAILRLCEKHQGRDINLDYVNSAVSLAEKIVSRRDNAK